MSLDEKLLNTLLDRNLQAFKAATETLFSTLHTRVAALEKENQEKLHWTWGRNVPEQGRDACESCECTALPFRSVFTRLVTTDIEQKNKACVCSFLTLSLVFLLLSVFV